MKPLAQQIAIAEACGWTGIEMGQLEEAHPNDRHDWPWGFDPERHNLNTLPDYLNDLNAMHEAVQRFRYTDTGSTLWASNQGHLMTIIARDLSIARDCVSFMWEVQNATAAQRAEAFLRTLNLWKEDAPTP